jgi:hypothetical protein
MLRVDGEVEFSSSYGPTSPNERPSASARLSAISKWVTAMAVPTAV